MKSFEDRLNQLKINHKSLINTINEPVEESNGIIQRYKYPILTGAHTPLHWRYDLNAKTNSMLLERIGINAAFNAGAIKLNDKYLLVVRVEAANRKSFFAVAESPDGINGFQFRDRPVTMPETEDPDTNVYDMRVVKHEDGWIYGLFCTERHDPGKPDDTSAAIAKCGIARTKDLVTWERLPDLISHSGQQRNVVLHPEFIHGKYALYTRPQDGFIETGSGGGIGFGLTDSMEKAEVFNEKIMGPKVYHTITEVKNGLGPAPVKTDKGWLHLAHGVRNTAAGLRYVLYAFMTDPEDPSRVIHRPAGYLMAPESGERIGDVSNVLFSNGWICDPDGTIFIYYGSSDTRMHVATTSIRIMTDYCLNTPEDGLRSAKTVESINKLIDNNKGLY
ncbi:MAG: glycosidase [Bacteroidales bacterium]|jgi:4-O-beta-D-mannosyl-D-glucose phosphorylase